METGRVMELRKALLNHFSGKCLGHVEYLVEEMSPEELAALVPQVDASVEELREFSDASFGEDLTGFMRGVFSDSGTPDLGIGSDS